MSTFNVCEKDLPDVDDFLTQVAKAGAEMCRIVGDERQAVQSLVLQSILGSEVLYNS